MVSCCQLIEHLRKRSEFIAELYALLEPGGLLVISSVRRAKYRLYYQRNDRSETILEPGHVHEFDSLDEFNELVVRQPARTVHTIEYQTKFSIFDFLLRRIQRLSRKPFTSTLPTRRFMAKARKATRIPIPGYTYVESVVVKDAQT